MDSQDIHAKIDELNFSSDEDDGSEDESDTTSKDKSDWSESDSDRSNKDKSDSSEGEQEDESEESDEKVQLLKKKHEILSKESFLDGCDEADVDDPGVAPSSNPEQYKVANMDKSKRSDSLIILGSDEDDVKENLEQMSKKKTTNMFDRKGESKKMQTINENQNCK